MIFLVFLTTAVAVIAGLPLIAEALRTPVTGKMQTSAPGQIARLSQGATHYRWSGQSAGPVAVLVHGLSTPNYIFAATERSLSELGYKVLTYDLYGRGFSDRAKGPQTVGFFLTQLRELLRHEKVTTPVTVLGFSMGGQIAAAFAAVNADRVENLILVAPSGLIERQPTPSQRLWSAPWTGDWLARVIGGIALRRELVDHRTTPTVIPDLENRQADETRSRGFLPAILSSRRHILSTSAAANHRTIASHGTPVLAIWGAEDPVIPLKAMGALAQINPEASHIQVSGAGHNLLQTHPTQVAEALGKFVAL